MKLIPSYKRDYANETRDPRADGAYNDPASPLNDQRLSVRARHVCANAGLLTRDDVAAALTEENISALRTYRNCGPVTIEEFRKYVYATHTPSASWDAQWGVAV